jgi:hypothetical protein
MAKIGYPRLVSSSDKPSAQPAVLPPSKVRLKSGATGETSVFFIVDAIEVLTTQGTSYGLIDGTSYPESFLRRIGHGADEPPEAA